MPYPLGRCAAALARPVLLVGWHVTCCRLPAGLAVAGPGAGAWAGAAPSMRQALLLASLPSSRASAVGCWTPTPASPPTTSCDWTAALARTRSRTSATAARHRLGRERAEHPERARAAHRPEARDGAGSRRLDLGPDRLIAVRSGRVTEPARYNAWLAGLRPRAAVRLPPPHTPTMTNPQPRRNDDRPPPASVPTGSPTTEGSRAEEHPRRHRRLVAAAGAIAVALVGTAAWAATAGGDRPAQPGPQSLRAVSGLGRATAPPWPAPLDAPTRAKRAGLPLGAMGMAEHYHAQLTVTVDGQPVPVPANIGVDPTTGAMSYLHTHTPDGVVHVEAGTVGQPFTLGQLFTLWDVRLTATQLGSLRADGADTLRLFVNGKQYPGNPARVRLRPDQQLVLAFGPTDAPPPTGMPRAP